MSTTTTAAGWRIERLSWSSQTHLIHTVAQASVEQQQLKSAARSIILTQQLHCTLLPTCLDVWVSVRSCEGVCGISCDRSSELPRRNRTSLLTNQRLRKQCRLQRLLESQYYLAATDTVLLCTQTKRNV
eukprot:GHVQ01015736.1.p1 GENE.GHVQ01015736.1~~GHVQ01015736.1.p1  ORF type:complete len:129 (+),score=13.47 GHVQ01015736.1:1033-1419(+)